MSVVTWPEVAVFANDRRYGVGARRWASEWRDGITSDACKALDCEAAIVQSKLSVDYGELSLRESLPPYILSLRPWELHAKVRTALFQPPLRLDLRFLENCCSSGELQSFGPGCGSAVQRPVPFTVLGMITWLLRGVLDPLCDIPSLHYRAGSALLLWWFVCEEHSDWLLVTRALLFYGFVPKRREALCTLVRGWGIKGRRVPPLRQL